MAKALKRDRNRDRLKMSIKRCGQILDNLSWMIEDGYGEREGLAEPLYLLITMTEALQDGLQTYLDSI